MTLTIEALTAEDRCDRCGARAVIAVSLTPAAKPGLLFCGHHSEAHRKALTTSAATIWDSRGQVVFDRNVIHVM